MLASRSAATCLLAAVLVVGGCAGMFLPLGPEGGFAEPEPLATYESGTARVELEDGTVVQLDEISPGPHLFTEVGGEVSWFNDEGWGLRINVYPGGMPGGDLSEAYVILDWVHDNAHWSTLEEGACSVDIDVADETGLRGTARCIDFAWVDILRGGGFGGPGEPIRGEEPFDAEISFAATP